MYLYICTYLQTKDWAFIIFFKPDLFPLVLSRYIDVRRKLFMEIAVSWMGFDIFVNGIEVRGFSNIIHRSTQLVSSPWTSTSSVETLLICGKIHWWKSGGKKNMVVAAAAVFALSFLRIFALSNVHYQISPLSYWTISVNVVYTPTHS